jgi:hypothetical protein
LRWGWRSQLSVAQAWKEKPETIGKDFGNLAYPGKQAFNKAKGQKRKDMEEFVQQAQLKGYSIEQEEE